MHNARAFTDKLKQGQVCLGTGISLTDPVVSEALAGDFDFFWIDMEHAVLSVEQVRGHLMAMKGGECAALVRVPWNDQVRIKPVLDIGADGIIVPMAQTADDVKQAVAACKYPPDGVRGFGPLRPLEYGRRNVAEFCQESNESIITIVQIEQAAAVENIDEILAVPGLTSVAFGPNDLAASLGYRADTRHPKVLEAMQHVTDRARAANIPVGISIGADPAIVCECIDMGIQWLSIGLDVMLMRHAAKDLVGQAREHAQSR
jgi:2-keto-3-deoxy-L-rhamnonate aldolase RhmA